MMIAGLLCGFYNMLQTWRLGEPYDEREQLVPLSEA
jgi:hypothetical protein